MKNKLLTLAGALALLAVLGKFYAKPVFAQVRAALVQNVDEPGRTPYQQELQVIGNSGCDTDFCTPGFTFAVVPANKRLVIKQVSATFYASAGASVLATYLAGGKTDVIGTSGLFPTTQMALPIGRQLNPIVFGAYCPAVKPCEQWVANQEMNYYIEAGATPFLSLGVDKGHAVPIFADAILTGYYVSLP